ETLAGGTGADTLTGPAAGATWTLTAANAGTVNGVTFSAMETLAAGAGTDTLIGPNTANTWSITATNGGTLGTLNFSGMESLTGGTNNDTFQFSNAKNVTGAIDGGTGTNALNYSLYTTGVTVNLLAGTATGIGTTVANIQNLTGTAQNDTLIGDSGNNTITANGGNDTLAGNDGNDTFVLATTQGATTTMDGGNGTDTVLSANVANTWTISGAGSGNLNGMAFSNVENLTGGTAGNTFKFSNNGAVTGTVDGGVGGTNTIDYSLYATGVTVNLLTSVATGTGSILHIANITGSPGNDT